jgi:hypothetical protein
MDKLKQLPTKMLQTGQRVSRKDTDELGTVVEAGRPYKDQMGWRRDELFPSGQGCQCAVEEITQ